MSAGVSRFNIAGVVDPGYENGNCDFCMLRGVRVKPLVCQRHFYCRTCNDFSPKFQRGDFQCRVCSEKCRQQTEKSFQTLDKFLNEESGKNDKKRSEVAMGINGGIISFEPTDTKEDSDDDLTGNNDEWEHLLQTMSAEKHMKPGKQVSRKKRRPEKHHSVVQRDVSFIKLVLPSAEPPSKDSACPCSTPRSTETETCRIDVVTGVHLVQTSSSTNSKFPQTCDVQEEERCTSPVKAPVKNRHSIGWIHESQVYDSEDDHFELLIDIETAPESPSPSEDVAHISKNQYDAFWDF